MHQPIQLTKGSLRPLLLYGNHGKLHLINQNHQGVALIQLIVQKVAQEFLLLQLRNLAECLHPFQSS